MVFDGGMLSPDQSNAIKVDGDEIVSVEYREFSELDVITIPRLANRLRHALRARKVAASPYLENGEACRHD